MEPMQAPAAALEAATAELQKMQMDIGLHCGTVGDGPEGGRVIAKKSM